MKRFLLRKIDYRVVSFVLIAALVFTYVDMPAMAGSASDCEEDSIEACELEFEDNEDGYHSLVREPEKPRLFAKNNSGVLSSLGAANLPEAFSSAEEGYITNVKNQGSYNLCWAYTSVAAMEASYLKNVVNKKASEESIDLSEVAFAYHFYNRKDHNDKFKNTAGDYVIPNGNINGVKRTWLNAGGNLNLAVWSMLNWEQPVCENDNNNEPSDADDISNFPDDDYFNPALHVQEARFFANSNISGIKEHIMDYGACMSAIYYDSNTGAYIYNYEAQASNHAITVVGWDDTIPASNFIKDGHTPLKDGAWLIKNSWGTFVGNEGFQWVSYEDKTICEFIGIACEDKHNYDDIYFYDGSSGTGSTTAITGEDKCFYNIFTNNTVSGQYIAACGVGVKNVGVVNGTTCTVQVYKNPVPGVKRSGTPIFSEPVKQFLPVDGYYTVKMPQTDIPINPKETFSVCFSFDKNIDLYLDKNENTGTESWYKCIVDGKKGAKISYYNNIDLSARGTDDSNAWTLRIKAYTQDIHNYSPEEPENPDGPDNPDPDDPDNPDGPGPDNPDPGDPDNPDGPGPDNPDPDNPDKPIPEELGDISDDDYKTYCEDGIPHGIWVAGLQDDENRFVYDGNPKEPVVRVYDNNMLLTEGVHYTVSYKNNVKAEESIYSAKAPCVIIRGKDNYCDKLVVPFTIERMSVSVSENDIFKAYPYAGVQGKPVKQLIVAKDDGTFLKEKKDYNISLYSDEKCKEPASVDVPGKYYIKISGIGNYKGELITDCQILSSKELSIKNIILENFVKTVVYDDGNAIYQTDLKVISPNFGELFEGVDYDVDYYNNENVGKASVIIYGSGGRLAGSKQYTMNIKGKSIKKCKLEPLYDKAEEDYPFVYTGSPVEPVVSVYSKVSEEDMDYLAEDTDYIVSYKNNINAGKATIIIQGTGGYTGKIKKSFTIKKADINSCYVDYEQTVNYQKSGAVSPVEISYEDMVLTPRKDFTVKYRNNKFITNEETEKYPYIVIKGKGNFRGIYKEAEEYPEYEITENDISVSENNVSIYIDDVLSGDAYSIMNSKLTVTGYDGKKLKRGIDYEDNVKFTVLSTDEPLKESDILPVGTTVMATIQGKGAYTGSLSTVLRVIKIKLNGAKIVVPEVYFEKGEYKIQKSDVSVSLYGMWLNYGKDYDVVLEQKEGKKPELYICGIGECGGKIKVKYKLKKQSLKKAY